jgi:hypothetical protein
VARARAGVDGCLCGPRRREIAALRGRHSNLDRGQLAIVESAQQTKAGIRYKTPKSGKGRMVALPAIARLAAWQLRQAEELLRVVVRLTDDTFICAREDSAPNVSAMPGSDSWPPPIFRGSGSMTFDTAMAGHRRTAKGRQQTIGPQPCRANVAYLQPRDPVAREDAANRIDAAFAAAVTNRA